MPNDQPVVKEVVKAPKSGNLSEVSVQRKYTKNHLIKNLLSNRNYQ